MKYLNGLAGIENENEKGCQTVISGHIVEGSCRGDPGPACYPLLKRNLNDGRSKSYASSYTQTDHSESPSPAPKPSRVSVKPAIRRADSIGVILTVDNHTNSDTEGNNNNNLSNCSPKNDRDYSQLSPDCKSPTNISDHPSPCTQDEYNRIKSDLVARLWRIKLLEAQKQKTNSDLEEAKFNLQKSQNETDNLRKKQKKIDEERRKKNKREDELLKSVQNEKYERQKGERELERLKIKIGMLEEMMAGRCSSPSDGEKMDPMRHTKSKSPKNRSLFQESFHDTSISLSQNLNLSPNKIKFEKNERETAKLLLTASFSKCPIRHMIETRHSIKEEDEFESELKRKFATSLSNSPSKKSKKNHVCAHLPNLYSTR